MRWSSHLLILFNAALCCSASKKKSLNFLMLGDWGQSTTNDRTNQTAVAYQMGVYGWRVDAQFVIALGDNFYENGIANVTDPQWEKSFHDVYSAASLDIPWYPILGNHDYHVDPQAQIDRSFEEDETMWTMPSRYYVYNYTLPDGAIMSVVNIDTQLIDTDHDDTTIVLENRNWRRVRTNHLNWIDDTLLEQSKYATWLIVTGHYPIYSVGVNGDNSVLLEYLAPILVKHKVHMYIAGHDHNNQYATMNDGICYVVSGQGAGRGPFGAESVKFYGTSASSKYQKFYNGDSGFAYGSVDKSTFNTTFVDVAGNIRFTGVLTNPFTSEYRETVRSGTGRSSQGSSDSNNIGHVHYSSPPDDDAWIGEVILVPGLLMTIALVMYIFRETAPVVFVVTMAEQAREEVEALARNLHRDMFESPKIRPDVEMDASTRSDVGFTADMDRSGRRENIAPRQQVAPQKSQQTPTLSLASTSSPLTAKGKYQKPPSTAAPDAGAEMDEIKV